MPQPTKDQIEQLKNELARIKETLTLTEQQLNKQRRKTRDLRDLNKKLFKENEELRKKLSSKAPEYIKGYPSKTDRSRPIKTKRLLVRQVVDESTFIGIRSAKHWKQYKENLRLRMAQKVVDELFTHGTPFYSVKPASTSVDSLREVTCTFVILTDEPIEPLYLQHQE